LTIEFAFFKLSISQIIFSLEYFPSPCRRTIMRLSLRATTNWASTPRIKFKAPPPMTRNEFRELCTALHIDDNGTAAELLGPSWRTCQRYWYGELPPSDPIARLLRLAVRHKLSHDDLRALTTPKGTRLMSDT
jgi:hypothetical protein